MRHVTHSVISSVFVLGLALSFATRPVHAADAGREAAIGLQNAFTEIAERASKAVVVVTNKRVANQPLYPQLPEEFRRFFGLPEGPPQNQGRGSGARQIPQPVGRGSGIILRADGYILTNYHVIADHDALEVKLMDGRVFDSARAENAVEVIGTDKDTDLAVLRIGGGELNGLPTLRFADSTKVRVGEWAIAIGAPFELENSVTVGVVSQKGRHDVGMSTFENYIQTDASINPGNSGGPLMNIHGDVIGVNDFIVSRGGGSIGLGFAISSNLAKQVADDLIDHGEVRRPWLGVGLQELTDDLKQQFGVEHGVLIREVFEGDPAHKAGLRAGDVVMKVGGKPVRTPNDLLFAVLAYKPGDSIELTVNRDGDIRTFDVKARTRDKTAGRASTISGRDDLLNQLGLALEHAEDRVVVSGVVAGSPADAAGLQRGDIVLEINRQELETLGDVVEALKKTKNNVAIFYIERRGSKFFVPVPLQVIE